MAWNPNEDDDDDVKDLNRFSIENELSDPLVRVSDVQRILMDTGVVPKHQVPLIIEKLREEVNGESFAMGDDDDDFEDFDLEV